MDPFRLDAELIGLAAQRDVWDELVGELAMVCKRLGFWRFAAFASFEHYCTERLGLAVRTVEQRAALARRLYDLPKLREALRARRVSYEQARQVARIATDESSEEWISRAERTTCVALRREIDALELTQMCARREFGVRMPEPVAATLRAAIRGIRKAAGRWLPASECLVRAARHFIDTHRDELSRRKTPARKTIERDLGFCTVPGCSRAAVHSHHVLFRSRGGSDGQKNRTSLCAAHHLRGVHEGFIRVWGEAPNGLHWELGVRRGLPPLAVFGPGRSGPGARLWVGAAPQA